MPKMLQGFWIKLTNWEFWSLDTFYFPVKLYYLWLALKNRSLFFFTASNPTIEFGGLTGESKTKIYDLIPKQYLPEMGLFKSGQLEEALGFAKKLDYPLIVKPDVGERGRLVERIKNEAELRKYIERCPVDFLIQELVEYPVELGVFYIRIPGEEKGVVTSVVQKDFMSVMGDGRSTVRELLQRSARAVLQIDFDHPRFETLMKQVPVTGEKVLVESIGNHCRGTVFLNKNEEIDQSLSHAIDQLAQKIDSFYFGRFDLRCSSFEDLRKLENFKVLELNGAGAEPGHIYQPGYSLFKAYKEVFWHFKKLAQVSQINRAKGHQYWTFKDGMAMMRRVKAHQRLLKQS